MMERLCSPSFPTRNDKVGSSKLAKYSRMRESVFVKNSNLRKWLVVMTRKIRKERERTLVVQVEIEQFEELCDDNGLSGAGHISKSGPRDGDNHGVIPRLY